MRQNLFFIKIINFFANCLIKKRSIILILLKNELISIETFIIPFWIN